MEPVVKRRTIYYRERYQTDLKYREERKQASIACYKRKTIICTLCTKRIPIKKMEEEGYVYDPQDFKCYLCTHPESRVTKSRTKNN